MHDSTPPNAATKKREAALREIAMAYPGAHEDFPWGERAIKVKGKVFLFMRASGEGIGLSTKLPQTGKTALLLPFAEPTHYGLGKKGWVSASFDAKTEPPISILRQWIDESYRAVAPKKLAATLDGAPSETAKRAAPKRAKASTARKTSRKRAKS